MIPNPLQMKKANWQSPQELADLVRVLAGRKLSMEEVTKRLEFMKRSYSDTFYVCEKADEVLGLLGFRLRENIREISCYGEISVLVVNPKYHGKGIRRFMMKYAEELAKKKGCIGTWLVSNFGPDDQLNDLYRGEGYHVTGYRFIKKAS
jgi:GNAT superfamily N-acetyltransferase